MKYKAQVNNHFQFDISKDSLAKLDVVAENEEQFHIVQDGKSYRATIIAVDYSKKEFSIKVNGRTYDLQLDDEFDQLVSKLGLGVVSSNKLRDVKAPMPGLVLDIAVKPGQEIQKGDKLLILEAMKMENIIKADGEGVVKNVLIKKGVAVEKGQLLIEME